MASDVVAPQTSGAPPVEEEPPRVTLPQRPAVRRPDDVAPEPGGEHDAAPRRRVRDRLARRIVAGQRSTGIRPVLEPLAALHRQSHPKADLLLLQRAYDVAEAAHSAQKRKSGDPYITHPLAVATVLAGLGMDTTTLVAALLHDTVEDTGTTLESITADFGPEVAHLVDGVTKIDKVKFGDGAQAETIRKMIVAMSRDPRVLVIKLADRLHNMRTLRFLPPEKQEKKARETLEILAPLAHRLGMNTIKWELEDLAFATLYPKRYDEIVRLVAERAPSRDTYLSEVTSAVTDQLKAAKIEATVTGRPKHYYSIYQKMIVRGRDFTDIWDLVGIRILVESVRDVYAALGIMHAHWQPVPGRFKDFVAMPKFNMYQSLHTTVIGPQGKPVELQIRTHEMHRTAEYGIAAHWKYKEKAKAAAKAGGGKAELVPAPGAPGDDMLWLRQLLDWQREAQEPGEFLETLRYDLGPQEVFVFTPKGDVISLPGESTPVDFAYAVHTEVGHRCIGARVNGNLVSLDSKLSNGDVVEVFTSRSPTAAPSKDWLSFVGSSRARTKIRQWFTKERREDAVEAGKDALTKAMRKAGLPLQRLLGGDQLATLAADLHYPDVSALYAAVGENQVSAHSLVEKLITALGGSEGATEDIAETAIPTKRTVARTASGDPGVVVHGMTDVWAKLAKCCTPVPGDDILGFVTRGGGVSVHRTDCTNAADLQRKPERLVEVDWASQPGAVFLVAIQVEALDRHRLLSDVTKALADERVNILSASVQTSRDRVAISRFTFELADPAHLGAVLQTVRNVDGVFDVERVTA
ncbi:RelA/SpoT family protein [Modestobacter italicus]|uniref:RelA/SpoT family protein n=1 Tax=Modestobacter italicus (strain DSM 44449 / CECT 9708 / BC 501) TaxID=2732864 RepID=UPI001C94625E|nr:bifunctional (p)ppGpp synthetase/guanosine-3',5'-bis(diphosphate) 3'-pyrophosphohydrolase [Modestobacter italicus]